MNKIRFAVVGSGWRSLFFHRIAAKCPDRFEMTGMLVRGPEKRELMRSRYGIHATVSREELLAAKPDFVVVAVSKPDIGAETLLYGGLGVPVLCETPPSLDTGTRDRLAEAYRAGSPLLAAEQYYRYPLHAAQLEAVRQGLLGDAYHVYISMAHDYHAMSLMRLALGVPAGQPVEVRARRYRQPVAVTGTRQGLETESRPAEATRTIATLEFAGGKTALYDFSSAQYLSHIRSMHLRVYGPLGELDNQTVRRLNQDGLPVEHRFSEIKDPVSLDNALVTLGEQVLFRNPYVGHGLTDDEIAIASRMEEMYGLLHGEAPSYPFEEALYDAALTSMLHKAAETGETQGNQ